MAKKARIFLPPGMANLYERHGELEVGRVTSIKRHHEKSRRYLRRHSPKRFKIKEVARLPGVTVWLVDGNKIRGTKERPGVDVDFTMGGHGYRYLFCPLDEIWIDEIYYRTPDFWATVWHEFFERTLMRNHFSYEVAHKLACRLEITLREGTYFILPVGTFRQTAGFCGPAGIKIYLNYLGKNLSERYIGRLCRTTAEKGTDPPAIEEAVQKLGFQSQHLGRPLTKREISRFCRAAGVENQELRNLIAKVRDQAGGVEVRKAWTIGAVKKSISRGLPVLANVQVSREYGSGHYRLIIGFTNDRFVVSDPDAGYCEEPIAEFMDLWYELEDGTFREGFTIEP
jgi:hypothetical protein